MAVPKVDGQFIAEAIKYIDENGVPWHNMSTKYELVWENGNTYPPKYVIAVANHLQNGAEMNRLCDSSYIAVCIRFFHILCSGACGV